MQLSVLAGLLQEQKLTGSKRAFVGRLPSSSLSSAQGPRGTAVRHHEVLFQRQLLAEEEPQGDRRRQRVCD